MRGIVGGGRYWQGPGRRLPSGATHTIHRGIKGFPFCGERLRSSWASSKGVWELLLEEEDDFGVYLIFPFARGKGPVSSLSPLPSDATYREELAATFFCG